MNIKQVGILAAITVALLLIYLALQMGGKPTAEYRDLIDIDTSKVSSITLYSDGHSTTLERRSDGWDITNPFNFNANDGLVKTLLGKLDDLRIETEVTSNKNRWADFELTPNQATRVTVIHSGQEHTFYIGKAAEGYRQSYARLEGKDTVYMIRGVYGVAIKRPPEDWRRKKVSDFTAEEVVKVEMPKMTLELQGDASWTVTGPRRTTSPAAMNEVNTILNKLASLRTSDFPDSSEYTGINWANPDHEVTVHLAGGTEKNIRFYQADEEGQRFFMRFADRPTVFRLYKSMIGPLLKSADEVVAEQPQQP